jgi:hypothetical protein
MVMDLVSDVWFEAMFERRRVGPCSLDGGEIRS